MSCNSCEDLRTNSPAFYQKGVTTAVCTSLKNDTGFSTSNGHNDCTDLNHANDCLVGDMETEVKSYGVCDWRKFMTLFIGNLHTVLKAIICAICGIWTKLADLISRVTRLECEVKYLFEGAEFTLSETSDTNSYVVAGKGVSFLERSSDGHSSDVTILYIAGGLCRVGGSLTFHQSNFTEPGTNECYNFDTGTLRKSNARSGNSVWHDTGNIDTELVYEIRISKSEYPQIASMYSGIGMEGEGYGFHIGVQVFGAGQYAWGQHGSCYTKATGNHAAGDPTQDGYDHGHLVPEGYIFVQVRMNYIFTLVGGSGVANATPRAFLGMRASRGAIQC